MGPRTHRKRGWGVAPPSLEIYSFLRLRRWWWEITGRVVDREVRPLAAGRRRGIFVAARVKRRRPRDCGARRDVRGVVRRERSAGVRERPRRRPRAGTVLVQA